MSAGREELRERVAKALYDEDARWDYRAPLPSWDEISDDLKQRSRDEADSVLALLSSVERAGPVLYIRRKMFEAMRESLREGASGLITDHMWLNPDDEDIAVRDLVPLYASPVGRAPEGEREEKVRCPECDDWISVPEIAALSARHRASEPTEAEWVDGYAMVPKPTTAPPQAPDTKLRTPTESRAGEEERREADRLARQKYYEDDR